MAFLPLCPLVAQEPLLIHGTGRGAREAERTTRELQKLAPQGQRYEVENGPTPVEAFPSYSCIILTGVEAGHPGWSPEEHAEVLEWVRNGGRLAFFSADSAALLGTNPAPLLGAQRLTKGKDAHWLEHDWAPAGAPPTAPWMQGGAALAGLEGAEPILGWNTGTDRTAALIALHRVGKGAVLYIGVSPRHLGAEEEATPLFAVLHRLVEEAAPKLTPLAAGAEAWGTEPLGPTIPSPETPPTPPQKQRLQSARKRTVQEGEPLVLAGAGVSSVILTPPRPNPAEKLAAEELADAFRKITGVRPPILAENAATLIPQEAGGFRIEAREGAQTWQSAILLGATQTAQQLGFHTDDLPPEGYRYQTRENLLLIAGRDTDARPPHRPRLMGTYYGALAFLENEAGVRWLWPGRLGEVFPPQATLRIPRVEASDAPALTQRRLRNGGAVALSSMEPEMLRFRDQKEMGALFKTHQSASSVRRVVLALGLLEESMEDYLTAFGESPHWFRRQRTGGSTRLQYTHAYDDWHERFGKEHPEWFALQPDGARTPAAPERIRLCKANTALTDAIAEDLLAKAALHPDADSLSISPNDGGATNFFCMCAECRKLDPANGEPAEQTVRRHGQAYTFRYPSLSDRVVNFYNRIATRTAVAAPDLRLGAYAYSFYRTPPLREKLHPNIVIGFVGLVYFDDSRLTRDRRSWDGWAANAEQLFLRPNALHLGHGFPGVFVGKMARDLKHCYETGMAGADFDSIVHHWATQGLNYYVLARLLWDPAQDVDALVEDYCRAGFGAGASEVKRYFQEVEALTSEAAAAVGAEIEGALREEEIVDRVPNPLDSFLRIAPSVYTPERLATLGGYLEAARTAAAEDADAVARIAFLQTGLDYASYQSRLYQLINEGKTQESLALFHERQAFFRKTFRENFYAVGLVSIARREAGLYKRLHATKEP